MYCIGYVRCGLKINSNIIDFEISTIDRLVAPDICIKKKKIIKTRSGSK